MDKKVVDENEYLKVCNLELKKHPSYREGMEIIGVPEGGSGSSLLGYDWRGEGLMADIVSQVIHTVNEKYELKVTSR